MGFTVLEILVPQFIVATQKKKKDQSCL